MCGGKLCTCLEPFYLLLTRNEKDKMSMASLVRQIDQILGCVPKVAHKHAHDHNHGHDQPFKESADKTPNELLHSLPTIAFPTPADIQERYVDYKDDYAEHERAQWQAEGDAWMKKATEMEKKRAIERAKRGNDQMKQVVASHR